MLRRAARTAYQRVNRLYAVRDNVTVAPDVHIGPGSVLWAPSGLRVERDVYIGKRCTVEVDGVIGSGTLIANNVGIVGRRDHDHRQVGTPMRRARWVGDPGAEDLVTSVTIGPDAWIGYGAVILAPCEVSRGAVVAAGAVVIRDVGPYEIVAGNPAAVIGTRFDGQEQAAHERALYPAR